MKDKMLIVCLTDNMWLYQGVASMLSGLKVINANYYDAFTPPYLRTEDNCIVLADMSIFRSGEWTAFDSLLDQKPDARVIWLKRPDSGGLLPIVRYGDPILEQKQNVRRFRKKLRRFIFSPGSIRDEEKVNHISLTQKDKALLPYFIQEPNMKIIAENTGLTPKTLYNRRNRISLSMGFSHFNAMIQVLKNNMHLLPEIISPGSDISL